MMQDDARWCKMMQDKAIWLKVVQDDARWCIVSKIKRNGLFHTLHHGTELFLCQLCGIVCDEMKEHVLYTASWYRTSLNIQMLICTLDVCKISRIGKPISSRFVVFRGVSVYKMMQNNARQCKMVQEDARWCKMMQDNARWCKTMQDNARWCKRIQDDARPCKTMQDDAR